MMKKFAIVLACSLALCLGLVACGNGGSMSGSSSSNESSTAASSASTASNTATSAAASSASASATSANASAGASADGLSYELSDRTFSEAYESNGKILYDTVGEFINTGSETMVASSVSVSALDENFQELKTASRVYISPNYILPGESAYVYPASPIELPSSCSVDDTYHVRVNMDATTTNKTVVEYPLSDVLVYEGSGRPCAGCRVTNDTNTASGTITVVVTYFDSNGQILGVGEDETSNLDPGESTTSVILGGSLPNRCNWNDVADYTLRATSLN